MKELKPADYYKVGPLLPDLLDFNLHLAAIIEGTSKGQIFVDEVEAPKTVLVATPVMVFYLGGSEHDDAVNSELNQRFPDDRTFYCWYEDQWQSKIDVIFEKRFVRKAMRRYYRL
ncbi:MAG: hypothetical protein ACE5OZ_13530 [Candidatus Heimdallarchaeota archaeon]